MTGGGRMEYMFVGGLALIILFAVVVSVATVASCAASGIIFEEEDEY